MDIDHAITISTYLLESYVIVVEGVNVSRDSSQICDKIFRATLDYFMTIRIFGTRKVFLNISCCGTT